MTRFEDWPIRLDRFLQGASGRPFSYGRRDCVLFAADWVAEATGQDHAAAFRGAYATPLQARKTLEANGMATVEDAAARFLGQPLPSPRMAQRGDVVSIETPAGPALGVCIGAKVARPVHRGGLAFEPLSAARKAWRV